MKGKEKNNKIINKSFDGDKNNINNININSDSNIYVENLNKSL